MGYNAPVQYVSAHLRSLFPTVYFFRYSNCLCFQLRIVQKSPLKSGASWKRSSQPPSCRRGRGRNWLPWTPSTGTMTILNQLRLHVVTTHESVNVSPLPNICLSFLHFSSLSFTHPSLCRNGRQQEEGIYQVAGLLL